MPPGTWTCCSGLGAGSFLGNNHYRNIYKRCRSAVAGTPVVTASCFFCVDCCHETPQWSGFPVLHVCKVGSETAWQELLRLHQPCGWAYVSIRGRGRILAYSCIAVIRVAAGECTNARAFRPSLQRLVGHRLVLIGHSTGFPMATSR